MVPRMQIIHIWMIDFTLQPNPGVKTQITVWYIVAAICISTNIFRKLIYYIICIVYIYKEDVFLPHQEIYFVSRAMSILIWGQYIWSRLYTLIYDNDVIIETVFVRFDLPTVDNTNCCDYSTTITHIKEITIHRIILPGGIRVRFNSIFKNIG